MQLCAQPTKLGITVTSMSPNSQLTLETYLRRKSPRQRRPLRPLRLKSLTASVKACGRNQKRLSLAAILSVCSLAFLISSKHLSREVVVGNRGTVSLSFLRKAFMRCLSGKRLLEVLQKSFRLFQPSEKLLIALQCGECRPWVTLKRLRDLFDIPQETVGLF